MFRAFAVVVALFIVIPTALAQSLNEIDKRDAAVVEAWQKTPLTVRHAVFLAGPAEGFGMYQPRASNTFKPGEKIVVYVEPVGYDWKPVGKDLFQFGFVVDFLLKSPDGKILTGKDGFAKIVKQSRVRNRELNLTLNLNLNGVPPGSYVLEYKLHDIASTKSTSFDLPFKIAK